MWNTKSSPKKRSTETKQRPPRPRSPQKSTNSVRPPQVKVSRAYSATTAQKFIKRKSVQQSQEDSVKNAIDNRIQRQNLAQKLLGSREREELSSEFQSWAWTKQSTGPTLGAHNAYHQWRANEHDGQVDYGRSEVGYDPFNQSCGTIVYSQNSKPRLNQLLEFVTIENDAQSIDNRQLIPAKKKVIKKQLASYTTPIRGMSPSDTNNNKSQKKSISTSKIRNFSRNNSVQKTKESDISGLKLTSTTGSISLNVPLETPKDNKNKKTQPKIMYKTCDQERDIIIDEISPILSLAPQKIESYTDLGCLDKYKATIRQKDYQIFQLKEKLEKAESEQNQLDEKILEYERINREQKSQIFALEDKVKSLESSISGQDVLMMEKTMMAHQQILIQAQNKNLNLPLEKSFLKFSLPSSAKQSQNSDISQQMPNLVTPRVEFSKSQTIFTGSSHKKRQSEFIPLIANNNSPVKPQKLKMQFKLEADECQLICRQILEKLQQSDYNVSTAGNFERKYLLGPVSSKCDELTLEDMQIIKNQIQKINSVISLQ